jgi:hypothetical protein
MSKRFLGWRKWYTKACRHNRGVTKLRLWLLSETVLLLLLLLLSVLLLLVCDKKRSRVT